MPELTLANSTLTALVDAEDYDVVSAFDWRLTTDGYVRASISPIGRITLHRFVTNVLNDLPVWIDHRDGAKRDCQKTNLRVATSAQNQRNKTILRNGVSGFKGVGYCPRSGRFRVRIQSLNGHRLWLGVYATAEEAARVYDAKARELFGEFACVNFPEQHERPARVAKERI